MQKKMYKVYVSDADFLIAEKINIIHKKRVEADFSSETNPWH